MLGDYGRIKRAWQGDKSYDEWMYKDLNNAKLASVVTYHDKVAGFDTLFATVNNDLEDFYQAVRRIAELTKPERDRCMEGIAQGQAGVIDRCLAL